MTIGTGCPHAAPAWHGNDMLSENALKNPLRGKSHSQRARARWHAFSSCVRESTRYVLDWVPLVVIMFTGRRRRRRGRDQAAPMQAD